MTPIIISGRSDRNPLPDEDVWANAGVEKSATMAAMTRSLFIF